MSKPFTEAGGIPVRSSVPTITYRSLVRDIPGRPVPLQIAISTPVTGARLPVIVLSHGHGESNFLNSSRGYDPLVNFWAAQGFVVLRPTHLDATEYGLRDELIPGAPLFWRSRAEDMRAAIDQLDYIETIVPGLSGRVDHERIAVVGHSLGGHTAGLLLGMRDVDPADPEENDYRDHRVTTGVLLAAPGVSDEASGPVVTTRFPILSHIDYSGMDAPTLVVHGAEDVNPGFSTRASYRADAFWHSPAGNKSLLTLSGARHLLGGIAGWDVGESADDEHPERVAALRALVAAYLRSQLNPADTAWDEAQSALRSQVEPAGIIETR